MVCVGEREHKKYRQRFHTIRETAPLLVGVFGRIGQSSLQESESVQRRTGECDAHRRLWFGVHFFQNRFTLYSLKSYLKMTQTSLLVIPAKAGIQIFRGVLDPGACPGPRSGVRRGEGVSEF
jgi:hypothetical protein